MDRIAPFHLKTLLAIARLGTYQAAADRLNTTQPAISARVRELEIQIGAKLFQRQGRRMSLTPSGRQLVLECEPLLAAMDQMLMRAGSGSTATGNVRISTGEIASASCLPAFVRDAHTRFPNVTLDITVDLTARMLEHLLSTKSDLVFLAGPVAHPAIQTASLGSLDLVWLSAPSLAEAVARSEPQKIWSLPAHSPVHHIVRDVVAGDEIACQSVNTCNNVRTLIDIVGHGSGIGLFPDTMIREELANGRLIEVLQRPRRTIEFQAAIRKRESNRLILQLFEMAAALAIDLERSPPDECS